MKSYLTMSGAAKRNVSAFLLILFVALQVLASVPLLHAAFHANCNDPSHECGVTLLSHGQITPASPAVDIILAAPVISVPTPIFYRPFVSRAKPVRPGRGPPLLS